MWHKYPKFRVILQFNYRLIITRNTSIIWLLEKANVVILAVWYHLLRCARSFLYKTTEFFDVLCPYLWILALVSVFVSASTEKASVNYLGKIYIPFPLMLNAEEYIRTKFSLLLLVSTYILNKHYFGISDAEPCEGWYSINMLKNKQVKIEYPQLFFTQKNVAYKKCLLLTIPFRADVPPSCTCKMWGHSCIHCSVSLST